MTENIPTYTNDQRHVSQRLGKIISNTSRLRQISRLAKAIASARKQREINGDDWYPDIAMKNDHWNSGLIVIYSDL